MAIHRASALDIPDSLPLRLGRRLRRGSDRAVALLASRLPAAARRVALGDPRYWITGLGAAPDPALLAERDRRLRRAGLADLAALQAALAAAPGAAAVRRLVWRVCPPGPARYLLLATGPHPLDPRTLLEIEDRMYHAAPAHSSAEAPSWGWQIAAALRRRPELQLEVADIDRLLAGMRAPSPTLAPAGAPGSALHQRVRLWRAVRAEALVPLARHLRPWYENALVRDGGVSPGQGSELDTLVRLLGHSLDAHRDPSLDGGGEPDPLLATAFATLVLEEHPALAERWQEMARLSPSIALTLIPVLRRTHGLQLTRLHLLPLLQAPETEIRRAAVRLAHDALPTPARSTVATPPLAPAGPRPRRR